MPLIFPNESRSFDEVRSCVRFSGYDGMFEVPFLIEAEALAKLGSAEATEASCLKIFDRTREAIHDAARRAYSRTRRKIYFLTAADLP